MSVFSAESVVGDVTFNIVRVTPIMAQDWLENRNDSNRPIRSSKVKSYAQQMIDHSWRDDRDPIEFDVDGRLINGQHRLSAIVEAGIPVSILIASNVSREDMTVIDTGLSRTPGDVLAIHGVSNSNKVAATTKSIIMVRNWPSYHMMRNAAARISHQKIVGTYQNEREITDSINFCDQYRNHFKMVTTSTSAAIHYLIWQKHGREIADNFIRSFLLGTGLEENTPIFALRRIISVKTTAVSRPSKELVMAWMIVAFNKWINNESVVLLRTPAEYPTLD